MIIDGKKIAQDLTEELIEKFKKIPGAKKVVLVSVGESEVTKSYVGLKEKLARLLGVDFVVYEYESDIRVEDLTEVLTRLGDDGGVGGIVLQLPLPSHIDQDQMVGLLPADKDIDALSKETRVTPPVVGAVAEICERYDVKIKNQKVVILGAGKLVGRPVAKWATVEGGDVSVLKKDDKDTAKLLAEADIVILGAGSPGFLKPDMIKEGVVVLDAGTSETSGKVVGDAEPACAEKCSIFTPVPGGIGPITLVKLFENLLFLLERD